MDRGDDILGNLLGSRPTVSRPVSAMTSHDRVVVGRSRNLASQLLEGFALGLGDEEGGEETAQHKQREDLHDVVDPGRGGGTGGSSLGAAGLERAEHTLGDDGADLSAGGGEPVRGGTVAGGEAFTGDDEGGRVGTEVEEELGQDVECEEGVAREVVVGEADDYEEDGEHAETEELNGLATYGIDERDRDPVSRDGTGADEDKVADGGLVENVVHVGSAGIANGGQDDGVVKGETVVCDYFSLVCDLEVSGV